MNLSLLFAYFVPYIEIRKGLHSLLYPYSIFSLFCRILVRVFGFTLQLFASLLWPSPLLGTSIEKYIFHLVAFKKFSQAGHLCQNCSFAARYIVHESEWAMLTTFCTHNKGYPWGELVSVTDGLENNSTGKRSSSHKSFGSASRILRSTTAIHLYFGEK